MSAEGLSRRALDAALSPLKPRRRHFPDYVPSGAGAAAQAAGMGAHISARHRAKDERRVRAAEAERIRHCGADFHLPRFERHEVEMTMRILLEQIRRRRRD